jgi:hypothetical protein
MLYTVHINAVVSAKSVEIAGMLPFLHDVLVYA